MKRKPAEAGMSPSVTVTANTPLLAAVAVMPRKLEHQTPAPSSGAPRPGQLPPRPGRSLGAAQCWACCPLLTQALCCQIPGCVKQGSQVTHTQGWRQSWSLRSLPTALVLAKFLCPAPKQAPGSTEKPETVNIPSWKERDTSQEKKYSLGSFACEMKMLSVTQQTC